MTQIDASLSGQFTIGGDITINRLGFGAMRITVMRAAAPSCACARTAMRRS
jgi:hypothetical protein